MKPTKLVGFTVFIKLQKKKKKFYIFVYSFAEIELHSDPEYLKTSFLGFHWTIYYASITSKNNHLSGYFGIGVQVEKSFGARWLVNHLQRLGISIS